MNSYVKKFAAFSALGLGLFVFNSQSADAAGGGVREMRKLGFTVGVVTNAFPSIFGVQAGYNITDFARVTGGWGTTSLTSGAVTANFTTLAGEGLLFVPNWNISPFVGFGFSNVNLDSASANGIDLSALGGFGNTGGSASYIPFGIEWQTNYGLNIAVEAKFLLLTGATVLPGFRIGWYF